MLVAGMGLEELDGFCVSPDVNSFAMDLRLSKTTR